MNAAEAVSLWRPLTLTRGTRSVAPRHTIRHVAGSLAQHEGLGVIRQTERQGLSERKGTRGGWVGVCVCQRLRAKGAQPQGRRYLRRLIMQSYRTGFGATAECHLHAFSAARRHGSVVPLPLCRSHLKFCSADYNASSKLNEIVMLGPWPCADHSVTRQAGSARRRG